MATGCGKRWIVRAVVAGLVVGACNAEHGESGHEGDSCLRSEDCYGSLECVVNVCVARADAGEGDTDGGLIYIDPCGTTNVGTSAQDGGAEEGFWSGWKLLANSCCSSLCSLHGTTCVPNGCDGATVRAPTTQYVLAPNSTYVLNQATCSSEDELPTWSGNICGDDHPQGLYQCCCSGPIESGLDCPPPPTYCTPGDERSCVCADGSTGTEVCGAGGRYASCEASCPCDPGGPCDCGGGPGTATCSANGTCLCGSWVETYTYSSSCADVCAGEGKACVPHGCYGFTLKFQHPYRGSTPSDASCDFANSTFPTVACCCSGTSTPEAGVDASGVMDAGDANDASDAG